MLFFYFVGITVAILLLGFGVFRAVRYYRRRQNPIAFFDNPAIQNPIAFFDPAIQDGAAAILPLIEEGVEPTNPTGKYV